MPRAAEPLARVVGGRLLHQLRDVSGQRRDPRARIAAPAAGHRLDDLRVRSVERPYARQTFVENDAGGIDVAAAILALLPDALGRGVAKTADEKLVGRGPGRR